MEFFSVREENHTRTYTSIRRNYRTIINCRLIVKYDGVIKMYKF